MINKFRIIALVFLCLFIAASTLYAADKESGISLFVGNDEDLALSAIESSPFIAIWSSRLRSSSFTFIKITP